MTSRGAVDGVVQPKVRITVLRGQGTGPRGLSVCTRCRLSLSLSSADDAEWMMLIKRTTNRTRGKGHAISERESGLSRRDGTSATADGNGVHRCAIPARDRSPQRCTLRGSGQARCLIALESCVVVGAQVLLQGNCTSETSSSATDSSNRISKEPSTSPSKSGKKASKKEEPSPTRCFEREFRSTRACETKRTPVRKLQWWRLRPSILRRAARDCALMCRPLRLSFNSLKRRSKSFCLERVFADDLGGSSTCETGLYERVRTPQ